MFKNTCELIDEMRMVVWDVLCTYLMSYIHIHTYSHVRVCMTIVRDVSVQGRCCDYQGISQYSAGICTLSKLIETGEIIHFAIRRYRLWIGSIFLIDVSYVHPHFMLCWGVSSEFVFHFFLLIFYFIVGSPFGRKENRKNSFKIMQYHKIYKKNQKKLNVSFMLLIWIMVKVLCCLSRVGVVYFFFAILICRTHSIQSSFVFICQLCFSITFNFFNLKIANGIPPRVVCFCCLSACFAVLF